MILEEISQKRFAKAGKNLTKELPKIQDFSKI